MILSQLFAVNPAAIAKLKAKDRRVLFESVRNRALDSVQVRGLAKTILKKNIR
jgi:hypothetical protein